MTAVAAAVRPATISPSARATASRLPKPSRCSAPALVIMPMVGRAMPTRAATSPARLAPTSTTAKRCEGARRSSVSGTPMWLLRLPRVARQLPACPRIAAVISLAVVLPLLPATPTSGPRKCARQARAARSSAAWVSGTMICGSFTGRSASTSAPAAPRASAAARKSWPSNLGPLSAMNSCWAVSVRESLTTSVYAASLPDSRPPQARANSASVRFMPAASRARS